MRWRVRLPTSYDPNTSTSEWRTPAKLISVAATLAFSERVCLFTSLSPPFYIIIYLAFKRLLLWLQLRTYWQLNRRYLWNTGVMVSGAILLRKIDSFGSMYVYNNNNNNNLTVQCARFKPAVVKECIREIVKERLSGMLYEPDEVPELCRSLADTVKEKVKSK